MRRHVTVLTEVQVEVDLRRFSTDILMEEIKDREEMRVHQRLKEIVLSNDRQIEEASNDHPLAHVPGLNSGEQHPLHGVYYALKFGKQEHALDLMRDYLSDVLGVVL